MSPALLPLVNLVVRPHQVTRPLRASVSPSVMWGQGLVCPRTAEHSLSEWMWRACAYWLLLPPSPSVTTESDAQRHLPPCSVTSLGAEASSPMSLRGRGWWRAQNGAALPAGWGPGREGVATGKVWPEPLEPAAGRKESPGGPHPLRAKPGRQKARALGRTRPASGDPGMSFRTEGQALSLITGGSSRWLSHGSLCPEACGNWLLFPGLSGVSDCGPSICHHP